jgi:putative salt-induced outer membrane protein
MLLIWAAPKTSLAADDSATATATMTAPWKGEAEAGAIVISGNSNSESYAIKGKTSYTQERNIYSAFGHYIEARADGTESAHNWDLGVRYDRELFERFTVYVGQKGEGDPFAGYIQRDSTDVGVHYDFVKHDTTFWAGEVGLRYSKTIPTVGTYQYGTFGRLYTEFGQAFDKTLSYKLWAEYLPNLSDSAGWMSNGEASLSIMLNQIFSLRLGYLVQYQNEPPGNGKYTTTTTTINLVAKF